MAEPNTASSNKPTAKNSATQTAGLFNKATRRYKQNVTVITGGESQSIKFTLPKSRLLSGCIVEIAGTFTATHASATSFTPDVDAPYSFIKNCTMQYNSSFTPFNVGGSALKDFMTTMHGADVIASQASGRAWAKMPCVASSGGTANAFKFFVDLRNMLNERDPVSLILLQSDETTADVNITFGTKSDLAPAATGYTFAVSGVTATIMTDTFSIPASADAFPDLSVLKLVQERNYVINAGDNTIPLSTGRTYRKIGMMFDDASGDGVLDSALGNIQLVFNQATTPYNISPDMLAAENYRQYRGALGAGRFVLDFSDNGQPNYGGARDYIDTTNLTEFWLKVNASAAGTLTLWSEALVRI